MLWINRYLQCRYVDGGRGEHGQYDCWGLVREVREVMGYSLLPSYGDLRNTDPREFTKAYLRESATLRECEPEDGAIAAVMIGTVCVHVAVVIEYTGRLMILEINPVRGPRFLPLTDWQRDHVKVTYHND